MRNTLAVLVLAASITLFPACTGTETSRSGPTPRWQPTDDSTIVLSSNTPPHNLPRHEYPFDKKGKYVPSWAREGERKKGRSVSSGSSSSHRYSSGGGSSRRSSSSGGYRYHKIKKGDTLSSIGRRYGKSVSAIKRANGLSSDRIIAGKTLKIPR